MKKLIILFIIFLMQYISLDCYEYFPGNQPRGIMYIGGEKCCINRHQSYSRDNNDEEWRASYWQVFIFDDEYSLMSLEDLEKHIKTNKHLPGIPSAEEIENNGLMLGETQKLMMQKIEELTLYIIELKKEINNLKSK
jgi:hypothetical protein